LEAKTAEDFKGGVGAAELWAGVLAGPIAMLVELQTNYALVLWACGAGREWALHLVALVALLVTVAGGLLSVRNWRRMGAVWEDGGAGVVPRSRFMAVLGMLVGVLFALVIIAQWIPIFIYGPCQR
jgi:Na+/proline symporter